MGYTEPKVLLCAGLITLTLMSTGIKAGHAALDLTLQEPLLKRGILPPEDKDDLFRYWSQRKKYFLVIAVNQTDVPKTELPFAQVDGQRVVEALTVLGYQPVDPAHPILTGKDASASAIMASLDEARKKEEEATLVVYYTGHGAVGPKDLWLQTAGQVKVGDGQGIKVSDLVVQVRQRAAGKAFEGELVLILDACYSGQGILSQGLNLGDAGKRTTILTSSTDIQESFSLNHDNLPKMSAFTYTLLQGAGPDWSEADSDHDGVLRWDELKLYAINQLLGFKKGGALAQPMKPDMFSNYSEGFLAYRRDQVRVWRSSLRTFFLAQETNEKIAADLQSAGTNSQNTPAVPKEAQLLAEHLEPDPEDYYTQGIKATTENQFEKARTLFVKATTQSQGRATQSDVAKPQETKKQGQIHLARARMETYAGQFTNAFSEYQQAAKISPPITPELLDEMGRGGVRARKYREAEPYLTESLKRREQDLAPGHPDMALSLNNLAVLYAAQERRAEAEPLYQQALTITEIAFGPEDPKMAIALNNLAELYRTQGKRAESEPLYRRALNITETALGPGHPDVAIRLNNLATLYRDQGKHAEAEPLYQRSFWVFYHSYGPEHPSVRQVFANYEHFLRTSGQPHTDADVWKKLRASSHAQSSMTHTP